MQSQDGAIYRRNRIHIRPTKISVKIRESSPVRSDERRVTTPQNRNPVLTPKPSDTVTNHMSTPKPSDSVTVNSQDSAKPYTYAPTDSDGTVLSNVNTQPSTCTTRNLNETVPLRKSTRTRTEPIKLKDYILY